MLMKASGYFSKGKALPEIETSKSGLWNVPVVMTLIAEVRVGDEEDTLFIGPSYPYGFVEHLQN